MVSTAEIRLIQILFKLIGNAIENSENPLVSDKRFSCSKVVFFDLKIRKADEKKADANSPKSIPIHAKDNEKFAPELSVKIYKIYTVNTLVSCSIIIEMAGIPVCLQP